jgi:UPF0271 protein
MMTRPVDLNADLGEGYGRWSLGDDAGLLDVITSANIACGYHAGDPATMRRTCVAAVERGVAIGAQVSYPDLMGFGRRFLDMDPSDLADAVVYQVGALRAMAAVAGGRVTYVKPHGALYHAVAHHEAQAAAVVDAVRVLGDGLVLLGLPNSAIEHAAARGGIGFLTEGFADRGYDADGRLVPRGQPGDLLVDPAAVAEQAVALLAWRVDSICVHSDTPGAASLAAAARAALIDAGATLTAAAP